MTDKAAFEICCSLAIYYENLFDTLHKPLCAFPRNVWLFFQHTSLGKDSTVLRPANDAAVYVISTHLLLWLTSLVIMEWMHCLVGEQLSAHCEICEKYTALHQSVLRCGVFVYVDDVFWLPPRQSLSHAFWLYLAGRLLCSRQCSVF